MSEIGDMKNTMKLIEDYSAALVALGKIGTRLGLGQDINVMPANAALVEMRHNIVLEEKEVLQIELNESNLLIAQLNRVIESRRVDDLSDFVVLRDSDELLHHRVDGPTCVIKVQRVTAASSSHPNVSDYVYAARQHKKEGCKK